MGKKIEFSKSDLGYIVNAIDISGMSYSEVGKEFGCSHTTIWRRYKEAKADLPDTELARLSDERKQAYKERENVFILESLKDTKEKTLREKQDENIDELLDEEEQREQYKDEYGARYPYVDEEEVEEGFFEKVKSWFKYILTGGDSREW